MGPRLFLYSVSEYSTFGGTTGKEGIDTELIQFRGEKINGCKTCFQCFANKDKRCSVKSDIVNDYIKECPINMECRLIDIVDYKTHDFFVGKAVETYVDELVLSDDAVDISKVKPLLFGMTSLKYFSLGGEVAKCWNVGNELKK